MTSMTVHLTHDQLCDLILADCSPTVEKESHSLRSDPDVVRAHLAACPLCAAELTSLRNALSDFREASTSFARQQFAESYAQRSSIAPPHSFLSQPLYWAAAVVVFVAALFPLTMNRQRTPTPSAGVNISTPAQTTESDEALLSDIDQRVSADIPSAMEPLADPTATATSVSTSAQRSN
ncbi:MAG TPA: hypothetical protein VNU92_15130 [Edaphobacter sp.]|jgi:hypothetical protein|nr:hypothetical protein [Edaphobacter sp.]